MQLVHHRIRPAVLQAGAYAEILRLEHQDSTCEAAWADLACANSPNSQDLGPKQKIKSSNNGAGKVTLPRQLGDAREETSCLQHASWVLARN